MTIGTHLLGRIREHDPASRNFASPRGVAEEFRNVKHTLSAPHLNQADLGSCEGNTGAEWLDTAKALRNRQAYNKAAGRSSRRYLDEAEAVKLYSSATRRDNTEIPGTYPPTDTGTSGLGMAKAMQAAGAIASYNWTFTMDAFLTDLMAQPIMLGSEWYDSMFEVDTHGYIIEPPAGASSSGGHAYLAFVLDWTNRRVGCTNHWVNEDGSIWGVTINRHPGCFWIRIPFLQRLLITEQGESLVPVLL